MKGGDLRLCDPVDMWRCGQFIQQIHISIKSTAATDIAHARGVDAQAAGGVITQTPRRRPPRIAQSVAYLAWRHASRGVEALRPRSSVGHVHRKQLQSDGLARLRGDDYFI